MPSPRTHRLRALSAITFVAMLTAWSGVALGEGETTKLGSFDPPASPGSTSPSLASEDLTTITRQHEILMTWLEPDGGLRFARLSDQAWSAPVTITRAVTRLDPQDRPSLTVIDTQGVRRTLIARTGDVIARSPDAGRTWTRLPTLALPFASFAGGDEGGYAFWLEAGEEGAAKLLGTRLLAGQTLLDPQAAGGSSTAAVMSWGGPIVVYRTGGAAQIALVRRQDAQWTPPQLVHSESARPVRPTQGGPQVVALRRQVAIAWSTAAGNRERVLVAFSSDAGKTFGAPVEAAAGAGDGAPLGPVDIALDDDGQALVLWRVDTGSGRSSRVLARVTSAGTRGKPLVIAPRLPADLASIPQITRAGERIAATWVEGDPSRVHVVTIPLAAIPAPGALHPTTASQPPPKARSSRGRVGEPFPDFPLASLDGESVSPASLQGRVVLFNLWATWCLPCIEEMPELVALQERYGDQGLVVVGLSVDDAEATLKVRAFVTERKIPFDVWLDPEMEFYRALRLRGLPASFVVDRRGVIVLRRDRAISAQEPELREALRRTLSAP